MIATAAPLKTTYSVVVGNPQEDGHRMPKLKSWSVKYIRYFFMVKIANPTSQRNVAPRRWLIRKVRQDTHFARAIAR
jgi:hypothetical protein